ncbi:MAG: hypothetical protein R3B54_00935 [Bdellovibrionota bacterium]
MGAWFALSLPAAETDLPAVEAPYCGWSVAHFNIFKPAAVVGAWKSSRFVKESLAADNLEALAARLAKTPAQFQYDMEAAKALVESLRSIEIDFPVIVYASNIPQRRGFEKRNPMDTADMTQVIAQISLRGVKSFQRSLYRSREAIRFYQNEGFDAVTYEITHFDGSRSDIVCYVVSKKDWFAPYGFDEAKPRLPVHYVLISNGKEEPAIFAHLEHGHLKEGPYSINPEDSNATWNGIRTYGSDFVNRGDIFPVAEDALSEPIEGVN